LAISLAVLNLSFVGIRLVMGIIRIWHVLGVVDKVDSVMRRGEAFFVECAGYEARYATPVAFWLGEYDACTDGCALSVVLLSTVPALARTNGRHPWRKRMRVLLVWF
jgi:hypothetical protein